VGAEGPYVVQFEGKDDSDATQTKRKYVDCGTDSCYFSSTEMFTLKPSSEYKITVYQCKYDVGSAPAYTWNTLQHGLDATNDECIRSVDGVDNYYAILEKDETTIASTNGKTSITYGCDAHRAKSPRRGASFSSRAPPFNPHASVAP
jgi:hypothetical protein